MDGTRGFGAAFVRSATATRVGCSRSWVCGRSRHGGRSGHGGRSVRDAVRMWAPAQVFEFAMQPPVLIPSTVVLFAAISTGWFEYGPRKRKGFRRKQMFVLRVRCRLERIIIELPDGTAYPVRKGENLFKAGSAEELFALTSVLEGRIGSAMQYDVYRVGMSDGLQYVRSYPRNINAAGGRWPGKALEDLDRVWARYFYLFLDDVDRKWISYREKLVLITEETQPNCRLCGGAGTITCSRCRGAAVPCSTCADRRRVKCMWCEGRGVVA
mmetsp:Transcript_1266/g.3900  ORF Transcript_1266/g.3900 Transcript_1266/m.3900 type:complete len:269 (+) Transcript_1266:112-918(+)